MTLLRKHRHSYDWRTIYCGVTHGASVGTCKCGAVETSITPAGEQQIGWWMQAGLTHAAARAKVLAGQYPHEVVGGSWPR
jgi:hypothetical protein